MTEAHAQTSMPALFTATLFPYRSMGHRGFMLLMGLVAVLCLIPGLIFLSMGAWPVFGFLGLDVLIVFLAFRTNYIAARRHEMITLTENRLQISSIDRRGRKKQFELNPYWTQLEIERNEDGVQRVIVAEAGKRVALGDFLPPDEKEGFAEALASALGQISTFHKTVRV